MRILYQNDEMLDGETYKLLKNLQIDFAKQQMIHTVSSQLSASALVPSEYQMIEEAISPPLDDDTVEPLKYLDGVSFTDKVQALQNDYFTLYMDSFKATHELTTNKPTIVKYTPGSMMPIYERIPTGDVTYYDYQDLQKKKDDDIKQILQGIDEGIVLEKNDRM